MIESPCAFCLLPCSRPGLEQDCNRSQPESEKWAPWRDLQRESGGLEAARFCSHDMAPGANGTSAFTPRSRSPMSSVWMPPYEHPEVGCEQNQRRAETLDNSGRQSHRQPRPAEVQPCADHARPESPAGPDPGCNHPESDLVLGDAEQRRLRNARCRSWLMPGESPAFSRCRDSTRLPEKATTLGLPRNPCNSRPPLGKTTSSGPDWATDMPVTKVYSSNPQRNFFILRANKLAWRTYILDAAA